MVYYAICPHCGKKLCRAAEGSVVEMQCPACREQIKVAVSTRTVEIRVIEQAARQTGAKAGG